MIREGSLTTDPWAPSLTPVSRRSCVVLGRGRVAELTPVATAGWWRGSVKVVCAAAKVGTGTTCLLAVAFATVTKSATLTEPILVTMLSLDVGEFIDIKNSKKSGLYGKLTKGRMITERVSRREHSSWNAIGVRLADIGDIRVTEAPRTSVEILGAL